MNYWLVKTEPDVYSIEDLERDRCTDWTEVRNYQARNYMRAMKVGDHVLVYHSNAKPSGVVGIAEVSKEAFPDRTQFDSKSEVFDPKATPANPRWFCPELSFLTKSAAIIPLEDLKRVSALEGMVLLQRGSRLSVQPVTAKQFRLIKAMF
jgi:predicted RNA-binding protein with PUA-like domain